MELKDKSYPVGDEVYPVDASMSGKNTFYLYCDQRGCKQNYGVCRFFIEKKKSGKLPANSFSDCSAAYDKNLCPAKVLHQEEIDAGRALYYAPRAEPVKIVTDKVVVEKKTSIDRNSASYKRGWSRLDGIPSKSKAEKKPEVAKPPAEPDKTDFERLVSDLSKEDKIKREGPKPLAVKAEKSEKPVKEEAVDGIPSKERILPLPGETPLEFARRRMALLKKG